MGLSAEEKNARMNEERSFLTKLFESAVNGDFETLKSSAEEYAIRHGTSVVEVLSQFRDGNRRTALHFACQSIPKDRTQNDIVEQMFSWLPSSALPALIRMKDKDGLTPLMLAAQVKDKELSESRVVLLLKFGSNGNNDDQKNSSKLGLARSHAGATALHYAAGAGMTAKTIKLIYEAGPVAISTFSLQGGAPLHWACATNSDHTEVIGALLDCGADINLSSTSDQMIPPPLIMAFAAGNEVNAKYLIDQAKVRNLDLTKTIDFRLPGDVTVFHMAADMNFVGVLASLIEKVDKSVIATQENAEGLTPLDLAARERHTGCVLLLLPGETPTEDEATAFIEKWHKNPVQAKSVPPTQPEVKKTNNQSSADNANLEIEREAKEKAIEIMSSTASITNESKEQAKILKEKGNSCFVNKKYEEAIGYYTQAIEADPSDATFYSNRSACYIHASQPTEALSDAIIARYLRPDWAKAAYRMAVARLELGRFEDAAMSAWEGLQQDQDNEELKSLLQKCVKRGRKEHQKTKTEKKSSHISS